MSVPLDLGMKYINTRVSAKCEILLEDGTDPKSTNIPYIRIAAD